MGITRYTDLHDLPRVGRFVPEMTYDVLSGTLNLTKLKLKPP